MQIGHSGGEWPKWVQPNCCRVKYRQKDIYKESLHRINPEFSSSLVPSSLPPASYRKEKQVIERLEGDQEFTEGFFCLKAQICVETS